MLRPKSKKVRSKVRQYILDHICSDNYDPDIPKSDSWQDRVLWVYQIFKREKDYEIKRIGIYQAFADWLSGLASALSLPFLYYESANELLQNWLLWTDEQAARHSEEECVDRVLKMVVYEFSDMLHKAQNGGYSHDFA